MSTNFAAMIQQAPWTQPAYHPTPHRAHNTGSIFKSAQCLLLLLLLLPAITHAYDEPGHNAATGIVQERAQMRWDALVNGQIETAYAFANLGFRSAIPLEHYIQRQTHIGARWIAAQVEHVDCSATRCEVSVQVTYQLPDPGMAIDFERQFEEIWILTDEQWWIYLST